MANDTYGSGGWGYMDGEYRPANELSIPVTDMGFQLGDMCYDALHVWQGRMFRLGDHLDRWENSVEARRYETLGVDRDDVARIINGCVARGKLQSAMVTWLATRGTPSSGLKDLRTCNNRFICYAMPYYGAVTNEEIENGFDLVIARTVRIPPESVDPRVKNFGRLDFVRSLFEAYDRDARYAVLLDRDGYVTEGRGWNIFALSGGRLLSPDRGVLEGITRRTVVELAGELNVDADYARITADELTGADEVFITSSAGGIMPVNRIDGAAIGDGQPGPVTQRLKQMYWALHENPAFTTPVDYDDLGENLTDC